jgi:hypothetical protein
MAALQRALDRFSGDLRGFASRVADSIGTLKRGAESRPHAGGARPARRAARRARRCTPRPPAAPRGPVAPRATNARRP